MNKDETLLFKFVCFRYECKETSRKKKKRTSEECYTGEKENVQDPYGVYW